jgi:hypothetical protein
MQPKWFVEISLVPASVQNSIEKENKGKKEERNTATATNTTPIPDTINTNNDTNSDINTALINDTDTGPKLIPLTLNNY